MNNDNVIQSTLLILAILYYVSWSQWASILRFKPIWWTPLSCYFQSLRSYLGQLTRLYCAVTDSSALKGVHQKGLPLRMEAAPASEMETVENKKSSLSKLYTADWQKYCNNWIMNSTACKGNINLALNQFSSCKIQLNENCNWRTGKGIP